MLAEGFARRLGGHRRVRRYWRVEPVRPDDRAVWPLDRELPAPERTVVNAEPSQFQVNGDCSVTGARQNGLVASSGRFQAGKRGIIGRVFMYDGKRLFGGSFVAVKRG